MLRIKINNEYVGQVKEQGMPIKFMCRNEHCEQQVKTVAASHEVKCKNGHANGVVVG